MKVVCDRAALVEALSLAGSVVPNRTTAPVLGCLSLTAEDGILTVASTNAEVGISIGVTQVEVSTSGKALVPADKLNQIVRASGEQALDARFDVRGDGGLELRELGHGVGQGNGTRGTASSLHVPDFGAEAAELSQRRV